MIGGFGLLLFTNRKPDGLVARGKQSGEEDMTGKKKTTKESTGRKCAADRSAGADELLTRARARMVKKDRMEVLGFAKGLARAAGALAMSYYGRANPALRFDYELITEADLVVQNFVEKEVGGAFPGHVFLGEEGEKEQKPGGISERPVWVVDPVDGSAAFCSGMPVWAVSLAVFDGGRPVVGVIYLPVTQELYSASIDTGAMVNDRPIEVNPQGVDDEAVLLTYSRFHTDFRANFPGKIRSLGSAAAHVCYVARGAATAAVLGNVHVWDVAAAKVILEAAGGHMLGLDGKKVALADYLDGRPIDGKMIAAPAGVHREVAETLQPA